jgi:hypothetical protein
VVLKIRRRAPRPCVHCLCRRSSASRWYCHISSRRAMPGTELLRNTIPVRRQVAACCPHYKRQLNCGHSSQPGPLVYCA